MSVSDPVGDMLTRIRNAADARHSQVAMPNSNLRAAIARILKEEGFIRDYEVIDTKPQSTLRIWLKYTKDKHPVPVINMAKRISKPGRRVYVGFREIPWVRSGMGIAILSTPKGVMTGVQARKSHVGGEVLCYVW